MVGRYVLHNLFKKLFTMQLAIQSTGQRQGIYNQERFGRFRTSKGYRGDFKIISVEMNFQNYKMEARQDLK